jgi:hypothetical protein
MLNGARRKWATHEPASEEEWQRKKERKKKDTNPKVARLVYLPPANQQKPVRTR